MLHYIQTSVLRSVGRLIEVDINITDLYKVQVIDANQIMTGILKRKGLEL